MRRLWYRVRALPYYPDNRLSRILLWTIYSTKRLFSPFFGQARKTGARRALTQLGEARFTAVIRCLLDKNKGCLALKLMNDYLDAGKKPIKVFYEGGVYGFHLGVSEQRPNTYHVSFGCIAGHLAGDGGSWLVNFDEDGQVRKVNSEH